jgi:hypothetical protein
MVETLSLRLHLFRRKIFFEEYSQTKNNFSWSEKFSLISVK